GMLNRGAERDERDTNREKEQPDCRRDGLQDFFRQAPEEKEAGDAAEERHQAQRHFVRAKNNYREPLEEQKAARSDLIQSERFRKEHAHGQVQNVARKQNFIEVQRRIAEVRPRTQSDAEQHKK